MNTAKVTNPESASHLTLELRSATGELTEFYQDDEKCIHEALRLLSVPRLFVQPHLLLASRRSASMIACKGIDMILVRTLLPTPLTFPLDLPSGLFDIVEHPDALADNQEDAIEEQGEQQNEGLRRRDSLVEVHTLGGWTITLKTVARFRGMVQDERTWFAHLPDVPTIPFRLKEMAVSASSTPPTSCA